MVQFDKTEFDIRGKTFDMLPKELQRVFNQFSIRAVVHQSCTMERISELVCRYNNHRPMNSSQITFAHAYKYARKIRKITNHRFFKDCKNYTETRRKNGTYERIVCESIVAAFHLDDWQKNGKKMGTYLNDTAMDEEFEIFDGMLSRLESVIDDDSRDVFIGKNSFIWFALFHVFLQYKISDEKYSDFLKAFQSELHRKRVGEYSFDELNGNRGTKNKKLIIQKLHVLEQLMKEYLQASMLGKDGLPVDKDINFEKFITENVGIGEEELRASIDLYHQTLDDLEFSAIKMGSKLLEPQNRISLLSMVAYSFKEDVDLDEWLEGYAKLNDTYFTDQRKNYLYMVQSLQTYLADKQVK